MIPDYWKEFVEQYSLEWKEIDIPESIDLTGVGAILIILDADGIREETEELYPGICVSKDGFIPVGHCDIGTGDPYFINVNDGPCGPLYRIYHDMVGEEGYKKEQAVDMVIENYTEILKYIKHE